MSELRFLKKVSYLAVNNDVEGAISLLKKIKDKIPYENFKTAVHTLKGICKGRGVLHEYKHKIESLNK